MKRIRKMLCLPADMLKRIQRETSGKLLQDTIEDIYLMGAKLVAESELEKVSKVSCAP